MLDPITTNWQEADIEWLTDTGNMLEYPTDEAITFIEQFRGSPHALTTLVTNLWQLTDVTVTNVVDDLDRHAKQVVFVTGGWSGNEAIIEALNSTSYRMLGWESSERGGRHVYRFSNGFWDDAKVIWPFPKTLCDNCNHPI